MFSALKFLQLEQGLYEYREDEEWILEIGLLPTIHLPPTWRGELQTTFPTMFCRWGVGYELHSTKLLWWEIWKTEMKQSHLTS